MSDLTIKAIKGFYNTENPTKEQIKKYKRYGKEFICNLTGICIRKNLDLSIIIDCRTLTTVEFKTKLGFNQHDIIMTKEQSVLTKIMKVLATEKTLLQHPVLGYTIDLYFPEHKLAIEVDEKDNKDRKKMQR